MTGDQTKIKPSFISVKPAATDEKLIKVNLSSDRKIVHDSTLKLSLITMANHPNF